MNIKLHCLNCGAEFELEFTIQKFKKFLMIEDKYICYDCNKEQGIA